MSKQVNVKAYPKDFKEQVVKLAQVGDRSATQIAREFEISRESVRRWVKQAELDQGSRTDGLRSKDQDELARLRREVRQLRMEREILSKAAAWFARETDSIHVRSVRICESEPGPVSDRVYVPRAGASPPAATTRGGRRPPSRRARENARLLSRRITAIHEQSQGDLRGAAGARGAAGRKAWRCRGSGWRGLPFTHNLDLTNGFLLCHS